MEPRCRGQGHLPRSRLLGAAAKPAPNPPREGACAAAPGSPCPRLASRRSPLQLPSLGLKPSPLPCSPSSALGGRAEVSPEPCSRSLSSPRSRGAPARWSHRGLLWSCFGGAAAPASWAGRGWAVKHVRACCPVAAALCPAWGSGLSLTGRVVSEEPGGLWGRSHHQRWCFCGAGG